MVKRTKIIVAVLLAVITAMGLCACAPEDGLTQSDVALLSDIVLSQTSCKLSDIRVIGVEPEKGQ